MAEGLVAEDVALVHGRARIVEHLDLRVPPNRFTAVLGANGSGKSTILRALAGLHRPAAGAIRLDGADLGAIGTRQRARRIGLLAQGATAPEGLTVEELVRQGRYPHRRLFGGWSSADGAAVEAALRATATLELRGRPLEKLSGGQRQRAWVAMTLAQESDILLLDEPTTYLDLGHQADLLGLLRRLVDAGGRTVVAVLHDLIQAARHADHIILLGRDGILAQGAPAHVLTPDTLRAAYGIEVTILDDPDSGGPLCLPRPSPEP
ncbi:MAG: cobalamin/Fe(3+)-siderophore ABC transporter ATP-binding protein [Rhodovulum sulfidophilum]|uniref:Cobalamin/Fe(3+)-siderophore ABC transporter ATP-binding protein n=1 Tax=Rhodovulum sulfidophilum TaxID=35806 RepID=A0A2W5PQS8_RHOSU|nr:MAG: cobalamin/Fe(3+)-siderophore ABC transporter ATP-binding protein [Rhodovulum sulfidophilum]